MPRMSEPPQTVATIASGRAIARASRAGRPLDAARSSSAGTVSGPSPSMARPEAIVATVCGGSLILGIAGLLKGRHAVTHHMGLAVLAATGATVVSARVVDDGNVVSAGGVTSGLDLALHLLERTLGPRIAHATESLLAYERRGTVWRA